MRKFTLVLIMLTLWGLSATVMDEDVKSQEGRQIIDAIISTSEIVIGDVTYRIDPDAAFYAADNQTLVDFSDFKEGDSVDFALNRDGAIIELVKQGRR